ncbi:hypothetical protein ACRRTK_023606 [Alexandromys fortis]
MTLPHQLSIVSELLCSDSWQFTSSHWGLAPVPVHSSSHFSGSAFSAFEESPPPSPQPLLPSPSQ